MILSYRKFIRLIFVVTFVFTTLGIFDRVHAASDMVEQDMVEQKEPLEKESKTCSVAAKKDEEEIKKGSGKGEKEDKSKDKDKGDEKDEKDEDKDKDEDEEKPDKVGNFSLSSSQQPGPLVGLGEHVIDAGVTQFFIFADAFFGHRSYRTDIIAAYTYGIADNFAIRIEFPYSPGMKDGDHKSSGIEDIDIQLEYAFYSKSTKCWADQATIVAVTNIPTGSCEKNPPTGLGATSWLLGITYNHIEIDWFCFGALGGVLTTTGPKCKAGNQFLYQLGIGRDICTPPGWIYAWMVEMIGQYSWKSESNHRRDPNSGGNVISIIPSLWVSSETLILQLGVGYPVVQKLFGDQRKQYMSAYFNIAWTFY